MTKQAAKQSIAVAIRSAYIVKKTGSLKMDHIKEIMNEKKITRTQLKATVRAGKASFLLSNDSDGSKTEAMIAEICEWIDQNFIGVD